MRTNLNLKIKNNLKEIAMNNIVDHNLTNIVGPAMKAGKKIFTASCYKPQK